MGVRGLETFLDMVYTDVQQRYRVYTDRLVRNIRFVVDGNNFVYMLASLFGSNRTGGVYDEYRHFLRRVLTPLAPSIRLVVFDGSKDVQAKARRRIENKCGQLSNMRGTGSEDVDEYERFLSEFPALFDRFVLYEVLDELGIEYKMAEGIADHVVALYANGHIDDNDGEKYTVLSKDSSFNIYDLREGYVSAKHMLELLRPLLAAAVAANGQAHIDLSSAVLPVFKLRSLLNSFCLDSHLTWIYFCVLLGTNDDPDLARNKGYFETNHVDANPRDLSHLIAHMKLNEAKLLENNFGTIRAWYLKPALEKIDRLISHFRLDEREYKWLETDRKVCDFDRIRSTVVHTLANYMPCLIEDYAHERSVFEPSSEIVRAFYSTLKSKYREAMQAAGGTSQIKEFRRADTPSRRHLVDVRLVDLSSISSSNNNNEAVEGDKKRSLLDCGQLVEYLTQAAESESGEDDLSLLMGSIAFWERWLACSLADRIQSLKIKSSDFQRALFYNMILLAAKNLDRESSRTITLGSNSSSTKCLMKILATESEEMRAALVSAYDSLASSPPTKPDIKLVHTLNEFQAIYYYTGALWHVRTTRDSSNNKNNDDEVSDNLREQQQRLELLSPSRFYNANFLLNYVGVMLASRTTTDTNNNNDKVEKHLAEMESWVEKSAGFRECFTWLNRVYEPCRAKVAKFTLKDIMDYKEQVSREKLEWRQKKEAESSESPSFFRNHHHHHDFSSSSSGAAAGFNPTRRSREDGSFYGGYRHSGGNHARFRSREQSNENRLHWNRNQQH